MDLQSLAAYQSAGAIVINNLWTKAQVDKVARRWLSPSRVKELQASMHEAVPVRLERLAMCPKPMSKTLNVVFCGRMTGTRNFKEVAELFRKQFSYPLGKNGVELRFIVSTNSQSTGSTNVGDISFVEVQKNNRQQFHSCSARRLTSSSTCRPWKTSRCRHTSRSSWECPRSCPGIRGPTSSGQTTRSGRRISPRPTSS